MSPCLPWPEITLASLAGGVTLGVSLLPPTPWLAPELHPLTLAVSAGWTAWRLLALDRTWAQRRRWQQAPGWVMEAADLCWRDAAGLAAGRGAAVAPAPGVRRPIRRAPGPRLSLARRAYAGARTGLSQGRRLAGRHRRPWRPSGLTCRGRGGRAAPGRALERNDRPCADHRHHALGQNATARSAGGGSHSGPRRRGHPRSQRRPRAAGALCGGSPAPAPPLRAAHPGLSGAVGAHECPRYRHHPRRSGHPHQSPHAQRRRPPERSLFRGVSPGA